MRDSQHDDIIIKLIDFKIFYHQFLRKPLTQDFADVWFLTHIVMEGKMKNLFDGLFDFNGDGKTSMFESALGMDIMIKHEQESKLNTQENLPYSGQYVPDNLGETYQTAEIDRQEKIQELQDQVDELHDKLEEFEWDEPSDWESDAHSSWEETRDELESRIDELESEISDLDIFF